MNPMLIYKSFGAVAAVLFVTSLNTSDASAQLGLNLPRDDFTWIWGDAEDAAAGRGRDISTSGNESGFNCNLPGNLRAASRMGPTDIRALENEIRTSLWFIQTAANAMNTLEFRRELDWAKLDCTKPQGSEEDAEAREERLDKAREKVMREQRARRERQQRDEQD
jgi:hypothetical protein